MSFKPDMRVVVLSVMFLMALVTLSQAASITSMCIRNCGQCKEMYGDYFHGQACAESCIMTQGVSIPDCNNPATFNRFLKRFI
ncbi:eclosion hormone [Cherax quadricarinatus]|uniref:Eclosion hormone protein n=2 Tax=Cherax quadricarinatus TaxID=27406 RepID=A0A2U8JAG1_CHEQU|nr:eclosion hormone-like [Cherax quadricarinatus]AWK57517.1 eclosion hormone protein [Cherax quadricarinatus]